MACRSVSRSRPVKRTTIGCVPFSSALCFHKRSCSRIVDTTRTGSGSLPASTAHGRTSRRSEIAKTRSASARICIVHAISPNGSSTRSSSAGGLRPDMTSSQPTIWRSSNSHQFEFGCVPMSPRPRLVRQHSRLCGGLCHQGLAQHILLRLQDRKTNAEAICCLQRDDALGRVGRLLDGP